MATFAFTVTIPEQRIPEFRELLAELRNDHSGLVERARALGYHRERMLLQPNPDGSARLITCLELDEGVDLADFQKGLATYESDWTRWWNPRYQSFLGGRPVLAETLFAWDDDKN